MTIDVIGIGAAPGDNTGDGLRTAMAKVNNNFGSSANAASKLVGTATGKIPTADDLDMVGATENFTSNNLNPNVFGGDAIDDVIMTGYAINATTGYFHAPIDKILPPTSITLSGSFNIYNASSTLLSTTSGLTLSGKSSSKLARIVSFALSGAVLGEPITLAISSANAKITVNT